MHFYIFGTNREFSTSLQNCELEEIFSLAAKSAGKLQDYPSAKIVSLLAKAGKLWADPNSFYRRTAAREMPEITGLSRVMVDAALDALAQLLDKSSLQAKLKASLGNPAYLDQWLYDPHNKTYLRAQPLGVVLHVSAGNVFIGGIDSLVHGFLSKNVSLLKLSHQDPFFPNLFAQSIKEVDEDGIVAQSFALLPFKGGDRELEGYLKAKCDAIVVWGGEEAVLAYREQLPLKCKLIEYGPKYSFAVLTKAGLDAVGVRTAAQAAALDIVMWEQRACSSPQVLYLEEYPGWEIFLPELAQALENLAQKFPPAQLSADEAIEILKARELAKVAAAQGSGKLLAGKDNSWSIIEEEQTTFSFSPLNRTIFVHRFKYWPDIFSGLVPLRGYLQSAALLGTPAQVRSLSKALLKLGVTRFTELGKMSQGKACAPHDGSYQLGELIKWHMVESVHERFDLGEKLYSAESTPVEEMIKGIIRFARENSPFYAQYLPELKSKQPADIAALPLLTSEDIVHHTPPNGESLLTASPLQSYIFASGGSTGSPKFCFYNRDEWHEVIDILADIYQMAGLEEGDRVANLFMAGNLWTSFIAANRALEKAGCTVLPIAGNAEIDFILKYLNILKPNAFIGIPSIILEVARAIEAQKLRDLKIKKILYGGEHLTSSGKAYLKQILNPDVIISAGYASVDAGPIGYQCRYCRDGIHHLLCDYQYLEILDPASGKSLPAGETGELVVTNLKRKLMPIIRYQTGDLGSMVSELCPCGRRTPMFELKGRISERIRAGSADLHLKDIEDALLTFPWASPMFQVILETRDTKDYLTICFETLKPVESKSIHALRQTILSRCPEMQEALTKGWLGGCDLNPVNPGELPRIKRTGKIKRVVDKRL